MVGEVEEDRGELCWKRRQRQVDDMSCKMEGGVSCCFEKEGGDEKEKEFVDVNGNQSNMNTGPPIVLDVGGKDKEVYGSDGNDNASMTECRTSAGILNRGDCNLRNSRKDSTKTSSNVKHENWRQDQDEEHKTFGEMDLEDCQVQGQDGKDTMIQVENEGESSVDLEEAEREDEDEDLPGCSSGLPSHILVGYAFGPKKMSTMSLIMAEASTTFEHSSSTSNGLAISSGAEEDYEENLLDTQGTDTVMKTDAYDKIRNASSMDVEGENDYSENDVLRLSPQTPVLDGSKAAASSLSDEMKTDASTTSIAFDGEEPTVVTCSASADVRSKLFPTTPEKKDPETNQAEQQSLFNGGRRLTRLALEQSATNTNGKTLSSSTIPRFSSMSSSMSVASSVCSVPSSLTASTSAWGTTRARSVGSGTFSSSVAASTSASSVRKVSTASVATTATSGGRLATVGSSGAYRSMSDRGSSRQRHLVRVSFVPLDLDLPVEEQHGGRFHVILHKLTEDILCMSKLSSRRKKGTLGCEKDREIPEARARLARLTSYARLHPTCCLVDHPDRVQCLMSRARIARVLQRCLVGVTTRSGVPVRTPRFIVWGEEEGHVNRKKSPPSCSSFSTGGANTTSLHRLVEAAPFTYPLIAKPITAAGTASSHKMLVALDSSALSRIEERSAPCILQEYLNHNGRLFKVYVLGNEVRVFERPSLPNLPPTLTGGKKRASSTDATHKGELSMTTSYVEFNSQKPYPKLVDFLGNQSSEIGGGASLLGDVMGLGGDCVESPAEEGKTGRNSPMDSSETYSGKQDGDAPIGFESSSSSLVTAEEIRPVADLLRQAFGLELFGFDILITSSPFQSRHEDESDEGNVQTEEDNESGMVEEPPLEAGLNTAGAKKRKTEMSTKTQHNASKKQRVNEMLVVDVNYFPSYKEVSNFPSLLARYLTRRAVQKVVRSSTESAGGNGCSEWGLKREGKKGGES